MQALIATSDGTLGGLPPFYRATPASIERAVAIAIDNEPPKFTDFRERGRLRGGLSQGR